MGYDIQGIDHTDLFDDGGAYELSLGTYEAGCADHEQHRDERLALQAAMELEAELTATVEFVEWQMDRVEADREAESERMGTPGDDRETVACKDCGDDCYPEELVFGACVPCRRIRDLGVSLGLEVA